VIGDANATLTPAEKFRGRASVITLGCAKNQVDSEVMLGVLRKNGFEIVSDLSVADVAVVNTCGFLQSSVKESIDCVLDVAQYKKRGRLRKLIVAGCMVERYKGDLRKSMPEVDAIISIDDLLKVGDVATDTVGVHLNDAARPYFLYDESMPRQVTGPGHFAYVKIAEGCNRPCTFCIIPKLRGAMRSRPIDSIIKEVNDLTLAGVKEVNLVAQDLTSYGTDRKTGEDLKGLLRRLGSETKMPWIRLLYSYPIGIDAELLKTIVSTPNICNYLDLPLQHASESVLKRMQRPIGKYSPRKIAELIRETTPEIALRTTFIVGFPGETEADVAELEKLVSDGFFSAVGVFTYSPEEGTPSADFEGQVPDAEKEERRKRIMLAQQRVVERRLAAMVGKRVEVLVEGVHEDTDLLLTGRTRQQAPDVDGTVIINDLMDQSGAPLELSADAIPVGSLATVEITEVAGYDLVGTLVAPDRADAVAAGVPA
jgi:ribosomal protein S12 methylthiotransferase